MIIFGRGGIATDGMVAPKFRILTCFCARICLKLSKGRGRTFLASVFFKASDGRTSKYVFLLVV